MSAIQGGTVQRVTGTQEYTARTATYAVSVGGDEKSGAVVPQGKMVGKTPDSKDKIDLAKLSEEDKQKLQDELDKHNEAFAYTGKYLRFKYDEEAATSYVEVINSSTNEVIVSLPPEFLIDLSVKMKKILGLFIDKKL